MRRFSATALFVALATACTSSAPLMLAPSAAAYSAGTESTETVAAQTVTPISLTTNGDTLLFRASAGRFERSGAEVSYIDTHGRRTPIQNPSVGVVAECWHEYTGK